MSNLDFNRFSSKELKALSEAYEKAIQLSWTNIKDFTKTKEALAKLIKAKEAAGQ